MNSATSDLHVVETRPLVAPALLHRELPLGDRAAATVQQARQRIQAILHGQDSRLLVIVGPCSVHDVEAAKEYATAIAQSQALYGEELEVVMRVYFEKPRTTVGWKGLINDPYLNGSFRINEGLRIARDVLVRINQAGLPAGCEFLDVISPQYIGDLVSWGAIGARTTESQVHRELASGLSAPVGFKNGTDGNVRIAVDAILAARQKHHFLSVHKSGQVSIVETRGNEDCHIILRGGKAPNYDAASVKAACEELAKSRLECRLMVDLSHANASKQFKRQLEVARAVGAQVAGGSRCIIGAMAESHLVEGRQDLVSGKPLSGLTFGQSITDPCLGWDDSVETLAILAEAVKARRRAPSAEGRR